MPQRFARIDISEPRDAGLVQQKVFQRPRRCGDQLKESRKSKILRKCIDSERSQPRTVFQTIPGMNAPKMATVREAEYTLRELQRNIHMNSVLLDVRAFQQFSPVQKPYKLPIEPKVHCKQSAIQCQKHIFAFAVHPPDQTIGCKIGQTRCFLQLHCDGMKDPDTPNALTLDEGAERTYHSFDFGQFRHGRVG